MIEQIPEWLTLALSVVGALTIVVAALDSVIDELEQWADSTPNKTDDRIVAAFAKGVRWASAALGVLTSILRPLALRKKP